MATVRAQLLNHTLGLITDGQPLAGAQVSGGASWGNESEREIVEKNPFDHRTVTTDADGRWSMKGFSW